MVLARCFAAFFAPCLPFPSLVARPVTRFICLIALSSSLLACGDFHERFSGYPTQDTVIHLDTASSNEIADALSQLAHIAVIGDDWEFVDPNDMCTVHVIDHSAQHDLPLDLKNAKFALLRDASHQRYYAIMKHGDEAVLDKDGLPLRLFEADTYHDVFFAEGYLQALAKRCEKSLAQAIPRQRLS